MLVKEQSKALFNAAKNLIPGGVNSPVRAFKAVGGDPLFIKSAQGPYLYDEDGNKFIELINSWGPMLLGHGNIAIENAVIEAIKKSPSFGAPTRKEVEMAELIVAMVPSIEMVRMVNSGTEATMSAIRLARGYTGLDKIIKFEGCYHGHGDSFLIAAGSGVATMGTPDSPGVTKGTANDTLTVAYNDLPAVEHTISENKDKIAAIIVEPVVGNMGCVLPASGFLEGLRTLCDQHGIVLIFDEVMTGFRLSKGGAQEVFGVMPDLTTLGKIIGGGLPVGAYGGRKEIMSHVSPAGPIYQAGTLSGNPIAMHAGVAMLRQLSEQPDIYTHLENISAQIEKGFRANLKAIGQHYTINRIGSMISLFFTENEVSDFASAKTSDTERFGRYFNAMMECGVYVAPSQFETLFVSTAIDEKIADEIVAANRKALDMVC
ncbi:MAG: glutamate-1-semialdehyde 2,1-aminomutase [Cyclobacteriaceae bacterium]|nr:glutamate-1-semialdehyde 2,1-aminomutase [Cyclobacteriaceae bacterium]